MKLQTKFSGLLIGLFRGETSYNMGTILNGYESQKTQAILTILLQLQASISVNIQCRLLHDQLIGLFIIEVR